MTAPIEPASDERVAFEKWLMDVYGLDSNWNERRNCFDDFPAHLAFKAWQAALARTAPAEVVVKMSPEGYLRRSPDGILDLYWFPLDDDQIADGWTQKELYAHAPTQAEAKEAGIDDDWRDDPAQDERWNAGVDFAQTQLCKVLNIDPQTVNWDAATETLDGDMQAVICNILRMRFGDDFLSPSSIEERLAALEAHSHEPFDFTDLITRLEALELRALLNKEVR